MKNVKLIMMFCFIGLISLGCASTQQQERELENQRTRARAHTDLGAVYFQQKQWEIALEEFTQATKIDPSFSSAFNGLGMVNAELGKDDIAESNFRKSIQLDTSNSEAHNNYGGFLCARNRVDESIKEFLDAVKNPLYATPSMAYTNAAICSIRKQNVLGAEKFLQQALLIDPLSKTAAYQLALLQYNRNDVVDAKKTLQNVMLGQPGPEVLLLAVKIERAVGSRDAEASYALQLRRKFPDSEQTKLLQNGGE